MVLQTLTAVCRLIRSVPTIVLSVTLPPKWNALVIFADELNSEREKHEHFSI